MYRKGERRQERDSEMGVWEKGKVSPLPKEDELI
jgi:hypothetical protein